MLKPWQHRCHFVLGVLAVVLVVTNGALAFSNRAQQVEINQRQIFLQQTASLEALYREMAKGTGRPRLKNGDKRVLDMLGSLGITVTVNTPTPAAGDAGTRK